MNETTYSRIQAQAMNIDASGAIVSGINGTMPVIGGDIEVLSFLPDNVIIGGYFELYILAERAGQKFATSEHVRFLQDQTVMKGTARYDGVPAIAEAFVAIGIAGVTPTATMTFATDTANA
jgi:HK97 family phage major capsid protein